MNCSLNSEDDRRMSKFGQIPLLLCLLLFTSLEAPADELWDTTRERLLSAEAYRLHYDYTGEEGTFHFRYTLVDNGERILTEVLDGSARGSGTRIYFDKKKDSQNVAMDTGYFTLRRSLEARDIKGTSLYQPYFTLMIEDLSSEKPTKIQQTDKGSLLFFGQRGESEDRLQHDSEGNPLTYRRFEKGKEIKKMELKKLEWGTFPIDWKK